MLKQSSSELSLQLSGQSKLSYIQAYGYRIIGEIARGSYGVVYSAHSLSNPGELVAIKILFSTVSQTLIFSEIACLKLCQSKPNLPTLLNHFTHKGKTHMVTAYIDFNPYINYFDQLSLQDIRHYMWQLLSALRQMKSIGLVHRDVKQSNFLYNCTTKKGVLVDLGLSQVHPSFQVQDKNPHFAGIYKRIQQLSVELGKNKIGTQTYMPLQSLLRLAGQDYSVDIWAAGLILLQLLTKRYTIFCALNYARGEEKQPFVVSLILGLIKIYGKEAVQNVCRKFGYTLEFELQQQKDTKSEEKISYRELVKLGPDDDAKLAELACSLVTRMLAIDPAQRISVEQAMNHPLFKSSKAQV